MAIRTRSLSLDTRYWRQLVAIAKNEGKTPEAKLREIVEAQLDHIALNPTSTTSDRLSFNSIMGAELVDWSDEPGPDPDLMRLQAETVGIAE